jgi:hypothetical protein
MDLPGHVETLRAVFTDPHSLDPTRTATKITREVATHLAALARSLEEEQVLSAATGYDVTPQQFLGIEVKPGAKEIAEMDSGS